MSEPTFNTLPSSLAITGPYYPLRFRIGPPSNDSVNVVAHAILRMYAHKDIPWPEWRRAGPLVVNWHDPQTGQEQRSREFTVGELCDSLRDYERFQPEEFNLPIFRSDWLDASVEAMPQFQAPSNEKPDEALTFVVPSPIGPSFPVQPSLDREGRAFSSLQLMLLQSWLKVRTKLVEKSDLFFEDYEWLRDLFMYLNTVVSSVDTTLHQIYYKAQYAPKPGWVFDQQKLGATFARRLRDKLRWVGQITGRPLHDCAEEVSRFAQIKDVRNHIAHFDPPVLAFTIEDVADWLNASQDIAMLLLAIRHRVDEPICLPLIELLLARPVDWYPHDAGRRRVPQREHVGYQSSCWPKAVK